MISHFKLRAKREAQGISKHKSSEVAQVKLKCDHLMHHHRVEYAMFHASRQVCRFLSLSLEQLFNFFLKVFMALFSISLRQQNYYNKRKMMKRPELRSKN